MPQASKAWALRFEGLSVHQQVMLLVLAALIGTEVMVLIFYSIFFEDRLVLDLVLSGVIVVVVGYPLGYLFIGQNVKLRRMAVELDRAARTDDLTGLANRRTFLHEADAATAASSPGRGALLYIDVDHFKQLNDSHGHGAGDAVLERMGAVIQVVCMREGDITARLGGEEFGIYLARADRGIALLIAERLRAKVSLISHEIGLETPVSVSIGLAMRGERDDVSSMMNRADRNLYRAKGSGRGCVVAEATVHCAA